MKDYDKVQSALLALTGSEASFCEGRGEWNLPTFDPMCCLGDIVESLVDWLDEHCGDGPL